MNARRSSPSMAALAASLVIACGLHAVLAVTLHHRPTRAPAPDAPASTRTTIEVHSVVLADAMPPTPVPEMSPPVESAIDTPATGPLASGEVEAKTLPRDVPTQVTTATGRRYFASSEVDTPAAPLPDWNVDVAAMMALGVERFSFDVLIGETGTAERCTITHMEPEQSPATRSAVASRLCDTTLRPAQRQGAAVPSIRHIELVVAEP